MNLIPEEIDQYATERSSPESQELNELNRQTHLKMLMPQMLSGHIQGLYLKMVSEMIRPKAVLEVGTFTGYAAICMASGLQEGGVLHTIDIDEELKPMILEYFEKAGVADKVKLHIGNAMEIIPALDETFDLVFIDADKVNYANYYDLVFDKVRTGGFILADNVLWSGKVLENEKDEHTQALHDYNQKILDDDRVENLLLPIRDGIMIARKIV